MVSGTQQGRGEGRCHHPANRVKLRNCEVLPASAGERWHFLPMHGAGRVCTCAGVARRDLGLEPGPPDLNRGSPHTEGLTWRKLGAPPTTRCLCYQEKGCGKSPSRQVHRLSGPPATSRHPGHAPHSGTTAPPGPGIWGCATSSGCSTKSTHPPVHCHDNTTLCGLSGSTSEHFSTRSEPTRPVNPHSFRTRFVNACDKTHRNGCTEVIESV